VLIGVAVWNFYLRVPKIEPASKEKMAFPLPDKPSIAVLPFVNMSDDPKQEYLGDGLSEDIITALHKVGNLFVIARESSFSYKGKPVKVKQVAEELGVRYVLEGSVRQAEGKVRITAQLIDAIKGNHLWAERYDRELKDIFAMQDQITKEIITALQVQLKEGEEARTHARGTKSLEAYLRFLEARTSAYRNTKEDNARAQELIKQAINLDPNYAAAYMELSREILLDVFLGASKSPGESLMKAIESAKKAIELDNFLAGAHGVLGQLYTMLRQHERGIAEARKAVDLDPSSSRAHFALAFTLNFAGMHEEAVSHFERAIRLNPFGPPNFWHHMAIGYSQTGQYDKAIAALKSALQREPKDVLAYTILTSTYIYAGREEEGRAMAAEVLKIDPNFSAERAAAAIPWKDPSKNERGLAALRKAGLPDKPPLPLPDKPSIAVLPFVNMSDEKSQEYFSDGLTEEIITALSKTPKLFVIARNSAFVYKGKPVNVQQVSRELGVKHVLEGSVRRSGDQLRITAQLIEASTGKHLWSERYERSAGEIFAVQDDITLAIVRAMRVTLTSGEQARLIGKGTKNLEAYLKTIEANEQFYLMNRQGSLKAKELAKEAISLDSKYAFPYAVLALAHMLDAWFRFSESYEESMKLADDAAHKALGLDDSDPYIQSALTGLYVMQRQYDKAIASAERALDLGPGSARSQSSMGTALAFSCRFNEAIPFFEEAIRLDPFPPSHQFRSLGSAYSGVGRHDEALKAYDKALKLNPSDIFAHLSLAGQYVELGRDEEARAEVREVLRLHPKFSLDYFAKTLTYKDQSVVDRRIELMRKAGLK
jgi:TolB-like protein/Tfp pilus assembly protein PilF